MRNGTKSPAIVNRARPLVIEGTQRALPGIAIFLRDYTLDSVAYAWE